MGKHSVAKKLLMTAKKEAPCACTLDQHHVDTLKPI